jgi:cytochrome c oxidase cbb3-type subunit 3
MTTTDDKTRTNEADLLDHEYDGIREYDNPMPNWWVLVFWATFVFSLGYIFHYHVSGHGDSVAEEYAGDLSRAREQRAREMLGESVSEDALAKVMGDTALVADARPLFLERCAPCHADKGQGNIGPNLTDGYWLHGKGTLMDIYTVVRDGVPAKGMPAWGQQLTPIEQRNLVGLIGSLRGQNLPGKPPQGVEIAQGQ